MSELGLEFEVIPSNYDEKLETDVFSYDLIENLATQKALDVVKRVDKNKIVIGADTVVSIDDRILGKPHDEEDAVKMIKDLQGRSHHVYTGVNIIIKEATDTKTVSFAVATKVSVFPMTDEEIVRYVKSGEPMDKAGAYAVQGLFAQYIENIEGDYYNIVGFPIGRIYNELKKYGIILGVNA